MCTVLLPPGDNPIAVNKYIITVTGQKQRRVGCAQRKPLYQGQLQTPQSLFVLCIDVCILNRQSPLCYSQYISVAVGTPKSRDGRYDAAHDLNRPLNQAKLSLPSRFSNKIMLTLRMSYLPHAFYISKALP